jgi:chloride channel 3/4/5
MVANFMIYYRPRVVLLEERGKLRGLVTVKDVLKYTARIESVDSPSTTTHYSRVCGGVFDKLSNFIQKRSTNNTQSSSRQPYTQLQNRSSFDVQGSESHELDGRL